ncbi:MAG: hypothetical protein IJ413_10850 [Bacteroides sp.]|nr:hypothetical protein [Bacteroides sp.]
MKPFHVYIISVILCLISCKNHSQEWEKLQDVETYIEANADSALVTLQNIQPENFSNKEEKAKHALLLSMAMDKNYIDRTDFEVLQPAIDYYQDHGTADDKLRTFYYEGRIYTNQGNNTSAIIRFNQALTQGATSGNIRTKARAHFAQANIYYNLYQFDKYVEENKQAAELFKEAGMTNSYANCLIRLINGYTLLKDKENAQRTIDMCRPILPTLSIGKRNEFYTASLIHLTENGSQEEITSALTEYRTTIPIEKLDWLTIANAYLALGNYQKALSCIQNYHPASNVDQNIRFYAISTQIYQKMNQPETALESYQCYANISDSIDLTTYKKNAQFIEEFHKQELENVRQQATQERIILGAIIAILVLSIICIWIYVRLNINRKEKEKYRLQCLDIETERDNLTQLLAKQKEELSEEAQMALTKRLSLLNRFFMAHITNDEKSSNKLQKEMEALINNRAVFMDSTRLSFAASHPHFIQHLKEHGLTEWEINYCCLYALGLKGKDIGTYIQMRSHYNQSSLIREKLGIGEHDTNLGIYLRKLLVET